MTISWSYASISARTNPLRGDAGSTYGGSTLTITLSRLVVMSRSQSCTASRSSAVFSWQLSSQDFKSLYVCLSARHSGVSVLASASTHTRSIDRVRFCDLLTAPRFPWGVEVRVSPHLSFNHSLVLNQSNRYPRYSPA